MCQCGCARTVVATHASAVTEQICSRSSCQPTSAEAIMLDRGVAGVHITTAHTVTQRTQSTTARTSILCCNTTINALALWHSVWQYHCVIAALWVPGLVKVPAADRSSQPLATCSAQAVSIRVCIVPGRPHALAGAATVVAGPQGPRGTRRLAESAAPTCPGAVVAAAPLRYVDRCARCQVTQVGSSRCKAATA